MKLYEKNFNVKLKIKNMIPCSYNFFIEIFNINIFSIFIKKNNFNAKLKIKNMILCSSIFLLLLR